MSINQIVKKIGGGTHCLWTNSYDNFLLKRNFIRILTLFFVPHLKMFDFNYGKVLDYYLSIYFCLLQPAGRSNLFTHPRLCYCILTSSLVIVFGKI